MFNRHFVKPLTGNGASNEGRCLHARENMASGKARRERERQSKGFSLGPLYAILAFILLTVSQGILCLGCYSPLTMPDPDMHVPSSWALATGQTFTPIEEYTDAGGNQRKKQTLEYPKWLDPQAKTMHNATITDLMKDGLQREVNYGQAHATVLKSEGTVKRGMRSLQYSPLAYMPQAAGIRVGMMLHLDDWNKLQAGRLGNMCAWLILGGIAIALMPSKRWAFALVLSCPIMAFVASSLMADAPCIIVCALLAAAVARIVKTGRASVQAVLALTVSLILLPSLKVAYVPLMLLVLALPFRKVRVWQWIAIGLSALIGLGLEFAWMHGWQDMAIYPGVNKNDAIHAVLASPLKSLFSLLGSITNYMFSSVTGRLTALPLLIIIAAYGAAMIRLTRVPVLTVLAVAGCLGATALMLLLTWTPWAGALMPLVGFQERYLLPLLPAVLIPLACGKTGGEHTSHCFQNR